jgi:myo-inositol-1(or 4)-monophosphatase
MSRELTVATRLALEAGDLIRQAIDGRKRVEHKSPVNLVTETDRRCESLIVGGLRREFPDHQIVAEESAASPPGAGPCWYVDPLDGTINFVHGIPHCSVSIALAVDAEVRVAVVYDPCRQEVFDAERGAGARLNGSPITVSSTEGLGAALLVTGFPYDRREHARFYLSYFEAFMLQCQDVRRFGSAALDLCYVAAGRFDGFWEWKLHPWDTAAGWLVVEEADGRVTDFDGATYDPWGPRILATNARIHDEAMAILAQLPRDDG